jgi:glutamate formiminotransferase
LICFARTPYHRTAVIECVPNFSEGRDASKVQAIVDAIASAPGVLVLGWESDTDHNRSVVTFAGAPDAVAEGAVRGAGKASELIDLNAHQGVHPRVGAADVIPFVPLAGATLGDCVFIAHRAGAAIWNRFRVPVYFYESAAKLPERQRLERVRRPGFDGLPPDIGDIATHPSAGASIVGARPILIAFNVNLATTNAEIAQAIARRIRESSGGFPFVKAMGRYLTSRGCAQVSMNLTNYAGIPLDHLFAAIDQTARALGTEILVSELVGFIPQQAYEMAPDFFDRAENFDQSRIIETRIATMKASAGHD